MTIFFEEVGVVLVKPTFIVCVKEHTGFWILENHFKSVHLQLTLEV